MKSKYFLLSLLCVAFVSFAIADEDAKTEIECLNKDVVKEETFSQGVHIKDLSTDIIFNGETKPLLGHINQCLLWGKFCDTVHIVEYDAISEQFTHTGDLSTISEKNIQDIENGNAVVCPFYTKKKTRTSNNR